MSSNFNNAKIINVYYNKGDRKPYDVNGKPIAYIGEEFVGSNEGSELRFFFGQDLDSATPMIITKRPDGQTYLDLCEKVGTGANSYYKVVLNNWYAEVKGKLTLIFKVYNGTVTLNEGNTEILSASGQVIVSDIFNLEVGYAPLATSAVPPYDPDPEASWYFALSQKLDKAQSITVAGALPTLTGDVYDDRYFYVENEGVGRLYYINGSTAIEVVFQVGTLKLTATGNGELTADTGKISWDEGYGGFEYIQYRDVANHIGQDIEYYGKAFGAITKGDVVQFHDVQGNHFLIKKAIPSQINANPKLIMGIAKQTLINNEFGYVAHFGRIRGINTSDYSLGAFLWFSSASMNNGELTTTQPTAPNAKILMAVVIDVANNGTILVRPTIEPSLKELQDVNVTSIANNQVLRWNNANLRWENTSALTTAESDIDSLEVRMTTEEGNVDSLEGRMTTAEGDIDDIEDGTTIVPKALADQNGNVINTTYLTQSSASATYIPLSQKGQANGVVPLGSNGKVPSIYLSGEQDDIQEFDTLEDFPLVGEADILYVAIDTNKLYRWGGSAYVVISETLALGTTNTTAFPGDRGLALETLTDNIVDGDQALALKNQVIRNTVVGTSPLVVNSIASTTANLQEWQVDGVKRLEITPAGGLSQNGARLLHQTGSDVSIYLGKNAGNLTTNALANTSIGASASSSLTSGGFNVFVGHNSGALNTTGASNVFVGQSSGASMTTGIGNTFIGQDSGSNVSQLVNATNSTAIGRQSFTDKSNQMVFGNASVTEFKFDRNTGAVALLPQTTISSATFSPLSAERTTTLTNLPSGVSRFITTTSADMADGFGGGFVFTIRDNANVLNNISSIGSVRSGADNSGRLYFNTINAGTETEKMTILPNGNVGIGTASPASKLQVVGSIIANESIRIGDGGDYTNGSIYSDASWGMILRARRVSPSLAHFRFADSSDNELMRINTSGNVGIGTTSPLTRLDVNGAINTNNNISWANGNADINGQDTNLKFRTFTGSALTEKMRILGNGNVGIGTSSPATQLHIFGADPIFTIQDSETTSSSTNVRLRLAESGASNVVNEYVDLRKNGDDFQVDIFNGATTITPFVVKYAGLVGINETSPTAQLTVKSGATNRVPLIVDTIASHTAVLQEWKDNGTTVAFVNRFGSFATSGSIFNSTSVNNALIQPTTSGTIINRNVADTNPALIVNLASSTATGNIQVWQKATDAKSFIDNRGQFYKNEVRLTLSEPTFTEPTTNNFEYAITTSQINDNDEIIITKTASATNQNFLVKIPDNSKNVRIWVRILPSTFSGVLSTIELTKANNELVKYVFNDTYVESASLLVNDTFNSLSYNVSNSLHSFLFENINGKQKSLTAVYHSEI